MEIKYEYKNEKGEYHRLDGPAVELDDGSKWWYVNGKRHRLDGPALEQSNGTKTWYMNDKRHRIDGRPAVEHKNGLKEWFVNGKRHRLDGPAVKDIDGFKEWWVNGTSYTPYHHLVETPKTEEEKVALINTVKFVEIDGEHMIANQWLKEDEEFYNKYRLLFNE